MSKVITKYSKKRHDAFVRQTKKLAREWNTDEAIKYMKRHLVKLKSDNATV